MSLRGKLKVHHRAVPRGHRAFDPDITVSVAGTRDAAGNPVPLAGVVYRATGANGDTAECSTDADGTCTIRVSSAVTQTYTVEPVSVPDGWFANPGQSTLSQVGVYTFGTEAPAGTGANNAPFGPEPVASAADAQRLRDHIGGLTVPAASFTNWDSGLRQITEANRHYDVVIVLTDGDPTRWGRPATPNPAPAGTPRTRFIDVENGIFSANRLKETTGTVVAHPAVLAVGVDVPSPGSLANLRSISGDGDYFHEDWDTLAPP